MTADRRNQYTGSILAIRSGLGFVARSIQPVVLVGLLLMATSAQADSGSPSASRTETTATATASQDGLTTPARIFRNRMATFARENALIAEENGTTNSGYIVLLGDSITQGFPQKKLFPSIPMVNRGISSDQVGDGEKPEGRGVINRLHESVWQCHPRHVFVLIGVNDIGSGIKGERLEKRHGAMLDALMEGLPATSITLQTILPARGRFAKLNETIRDSNERLEKLAEERGITVLDTHGIMKDDQGMLRDDFTSDGLHLNAKANEAWATVLREEMSRLGYLSK